MTKGLVCYSARCVSGCSLTRGRVCYSGRCGSGCSLTKGIVCSVVGVFQGVVVLTCMLQW